MAIIADARKTDWSYAGATIVARAQYGSTIAAGASLSTINTAITNCSNAGGGMVVLGAGTFNLAGCIVMKNNVVLRGQGMSTILNFTSQGGGGFYWMGGDIAIQFQGSGWSGSGDSSAPGMGGVPSGTIRGWTGTNGQAGVYTQGATVLNLASAPTGLTVGGMITLWQADASDGSIPNGGYFVSDKSGGAGAISWKGTSESHNAGQTQRSRVTAINGSAVTIAAPGVTRPVGTWATGLSPQAGWQSGVITGAGLENLRVVRTGSHQGTIGLNSAMDCWIMNVGITGTITCALGIFASDSCNLTFKNNWIDRIFGGGGGQYTSYGINMTQCSHLLVENNVLNQVESPVMLNCGSTGCVIGYNYEYFSSGEGGIQLHEEGAAMNLFECNTTMKFWLDTIHGNTQLNTGFRNYTYSGDVGFDIWTYNRWYNIIGNVIQADTVYKSLSTDSTRYTRFGAANNGGVGIRMGYGSQYEGPENHDSADVGSSNQAHDPIVASSAMLWGNYCNQGNSVRWLSAEVPTADPTFPNPVPPDQTLPASMYLSGRPGFMTWNGQTVTYPPIGPEVTGGIAMGGRVYKLPAQLEFERAGQSVANFNPALYGTTGAPSLLPAPTNLRWRPV